MHLQHILYNNMDAQATQIANQHYLFSMDHPHSERTTIKSFHMFQDGRHYRMLAVANHNSLEVYRSVGGSLVFDRSHDFMCDISVLVVVPIKGDACDVLFLADEDGRYMFWSPLYGGLSVSNQSRTLDAKLPFYQNDSPQTKQPQFSDINFTFNSLTTLALIFFNVGTAKVIILRIEATKNCIHDVHPPAQFQIPYPDINHIGLLKGKNPSVGFVEQREEKTVLQIHSLSNQHFELTFTLEKSNLSRFYCSQNGEELVTVCSSELTITNLKTNKLVCNFQTRETGFVTALDNDKYIFVGEVGSEMIVFGKKCYKNYGSFMLENDRCVVLQAHGQLSDGGYLISVIDQGFTVEVLSIYEEHWKSIKSISSVASIFSIQQMEAVPFRDPKLKQSLGVVRVSDNIHQVGIISKKVATKLEKQTSINSPILQTFAFNEGYALLLAAQSSNTVLLYDKGSQNFEVSFELPPEELLLAANGYLVTVQKIYEINLSKNRINEIYTEKESRMVAADFDGSKYIGFQCSNFAYKFFNLQTKEIDWVRKNCHEEYIWRFHNGDLLAGSIDCLGELKVFPPFSAPKPSLNLNADELVSDMRNMGETDCLVVCFVSSVINVYLVSSNELVYTLAASGQAMRVLKCSGSSVLAYGVNSAHYLRMDSKEGISVKQVDFDGAKDIIDCVYLKEQDQVLITSGEAVATYSLPSALTQSETSSFKILSVNICDSSDEGQVPLASTHDSYLYVATAYELVKRDLLSAELAKKQSHTLKEVTCMENLASGLLVCGVDDMDYAQILLFDYEDLQIVCNESLSKQVLSAARLLKDDSFFLRLDQFITLYEFLPSTGNFKQKFTSKIGLYGYTLALEPVHSILILSDPLRYVAAYNYESNKMTALCRYGNLNTINDIEFVNKSVIFGDTVGNVVVLEFNLEEDEVSRTKMSEVGTLRFGSELMYIRKSKSDPENTVVFSALSGYIGRVSAIPQNRYKLLKQVEEKALKLLKSEEFDYLAWRKRANLEDKLIDDHLLCEFVRRASPEDPLLLDLKKIYPF